MIQVKYLLLPITTIVGITIFSGCGKDNEKKQYSVRRAAIRPQWTTSKRQTDTPGGVTDLSGAGGPGPSTTVEAPTTPVATSSGVGDQTLSVQKNLIGTEIDENNLRTKLDSITPKTSAIPLNDVTAGKYQLIQLIINQEKTAQNGQKHKALFTIDSRGNAEAFIMNFGTDEISSNETPEFQLFYPQTFTITKANGEAQLQDTNSQSLSLAIKRDSSNKILFNYRISNGAQNLLSSLVTLLSINLDIYNGATKSYKVSDATDNPLNNRHIAVYQNTSQQLTLTDFPIEDDSAENSIQSYVYLIFNKTN